MDQFDIALYEQEQQKLGGTYCQDVSIDAARLNSNFTHNINDDRTATKEDVDNEMKLTRERCTVIGG